MEKLVEHKFITQEWIDFVPEAFAEFKDKIGPELLKTESYYPATDKIFRALNECNPDDVKVVILGQDPYHDGSATGLAFDNRNNKVRISPSLQNILKEMVQDGDFTNWQNNSVTTGSKLSHLPAQGVLLINTALTVLRGKPDSHTDLWKEFTKQLITSLNKNDNIIWILWGNHAKSFKQYITNTTHLFIESAHPSPFSANRGFFGSKPFSKANSYLKTLSKSPINW